MEDNHKNDPLKAKELLLALAIKDIDKPFLSKKKKLRYQNVIKNYPAIIENDKLYLKILKSPDGTIKMD